MNYPDKPQYILYKLVERPGKPKPDKVPCDVTGAEIDPHNPAQWMTRDAADAAAGPGLYVGFVLTATDPYFVLDIDDCYDPETEQYDARATEWGTWFAGFGVELSVNGRGIHIWGVCEAGIAETHKNRDKDRKYEFYQAGRFIALGTPLGGDIGKDGSDLLRAHLTLRPVSESTGLPDVGPVPEYTGPEDDAELIQMACAAKGGIAAQFGDKARFIDLWNGDEAKLAKFFPPDSDDTIGRSEADAALCAHLAFWTGKDVARIERLWLSSPLASKRPDQKKLKRADYLRETIRGAAEKCTAVYSTPRKAAPASDVPTGVPGEVDREYLTVFDQDKHFEGCVYVVEDNKIMTPDGKMLKEKQFKIVYGGYEFQMQADGSRPTRDAWEAFTQNRARRFPKVDRKMFNPDHPFGAIVGDAVNIFKPNAAVDVEGDPSPYLELVAKLLPDERDRAIFLTWCAALVQNPGRKFQWSIVLQGAEGNGKTFLMNAVAHAVGWNLSHLPNPEDMDEKYNTYLEGNVFIGVEEIHMGGRRSLLDRLKKYITGTRAEIRGMAEDKRMSDNLTNWMFLTNFHDAIIKTKNDRRYAVFFTAQQDSPDLVRDGMSGDYFPRLWEWARSGGFDIIATWLRRMPLDARFDPLGACHRAPDTSSTGAAVAASYGKVEQEILEAIAEGRQGFRGGWLSSVRLAELMERRNIRISRNALADAVKTLGYQKFSKLRDGRAAPMMEEGGKRPCLYCLPYVDAEANSAADYRDAQGYEGPKIEAPVTDMASPSQVRH